MNKKLKKLQADYASGKLTKAQYQAAVKALLDDEEIDQDDHDKALEFQPDDDDDQDKAIYTQSDMDRAVLKKARSLVRKTLREAGVDLTDVSNADLLDALVSRVKDTDGKGDKTDDKQLAALRKKADKADSLEAQVKKLTIENAVLSAAGKYNPHNPAQVVRALQADYADLIEIDEETGQIDRKSVDNAIKRVAKIEPNLFKQATGKQDEEEDDEIDEQGDKSQADGKKSFSSKSPGGTGVAADKKQKQEEKLFQEAMDMLKIKTDKK